MTDLTMREVVVTIAKDGTTTFDVKGAKGSQCLDLTKGMEQAIGGAKEENRQKKPDFYQPIVNVGGVGSYG